jgi:hypothetical protein
VQSIPIVKHIATQHDKKIYNTNKKNDGTALVVFKDFLTILVIKKCDYRGENVEKMNFRN